jgi:hypothetical protein
VHHQQQTEPEPGGTETLGPGPVCCTPRPETCGVWGCIYGVEVNLTIPVWGRLACAARMNAVALACRDGMPLGNGIPPPAGGRPRDTPASKASGSAVLRTKWGRHATPDAVEFIARQRVALLAGGQRLSQDGAIVAGATRLLDKDVIALDAEQLGGVDLQTLSASETWPQMSGYSLPEIAPGQRNGRE